MNLIYVFLGFFCYFIVNRVIEVLNRRAGQECGYDCEKCAYKCTGVYCARRRNTLFMPAAGAAEEDCNTPPED